MACDPASFKVRFPEFVSVVDARIQVFIDDAVIILNEVYWGLKYDLGICYLAAHYLSLANKTEAGSTTSNNAISGRAVDGVSVSFSTPTPENQGDAYYSATSYGQRYLAMRKTLGVPASVI